MSLIYFFWGGEGEVGVRFKSYFTLYIKRLKLPFFKIDNFVGFKFNLNLSFCYVNSDISGFALNRDVD